MQLLEVARQETSRIVRSSNSHSISGIGRKILNCCTCTVVMITRGAISFVVVIATATTITCTKRVSAFASLRHQYQTRPCTQYTFTDKQLDRRLSAESSSSSSTTTMTTENEQAATASIPPLAKTAKRLFFVRHGEVMCIFI